MPSKNKRAASRQAKLSQRRRRRVGGRRQKTTERSATSAAGVTVASGRRSSTPTAATQTRTPAVAVPSASTAQRPARHVAAAPRARTRAAQNRAATYEPLPMYAYLGSELKRIGAVAAVMAVALATLTVVLGQA